MRTLRHAAGIATALCLSACMTDDPLTRTAPASPADSIAIDSSYVNRVEMLARARGIRITWLNPPSARTKQEKR